MFPRDIQYIISTYQILGVFPLDKALHILVGVVVTLFMRFSGAKMKHVFIVLGILELVKEIIDSATMTNTLEENIVDALATFSYPLILCLVIKIKTMLKKSTEQR